MASLEGAEPPSHARRPRPRLSLAGFGGRLLIVVLSSLAATPVLPAAHVVIWAAVALGVGAVEYAISSGNSEDPCRRPGLAAVLSVASSSLYASAAMALIIWGGPAARLYSFALMAVSMVDVLMRHYQKPWVFLASIAPNMAVLGLVEWGLVQKALEHHAPLAALTPIATLALFAALFWTARAQLASSWTALTQAKTEAQERERAAEAANRAKSHFLATMSHEIRTPLNGVLGMAQAMNGDELSGVQRERLKTIRRSGETLLAVLNDVLDLSKIEASKLELEIVEFDLAHVARGVVAAFTPLANRKGVSFAFEIEPAAEGAYRGDSSRLRQILYNLIANAVKFTEAGHVAFSIRRDGEDLVFDIADTGIGMSREVLDRLFDNFFQADASTTRRYGGSGLGLAICRELVALMDGEIEAQSAPGAGSTFRLRLPLPRVGDVQARPSALAATPPEARAEPGAIRLLAAEDNDVNQLVLKTLLLQAGIDPVIVPNGREAVEAWEAQDWDVILMDVQMPEMDGPSATRAIRAGELVTGRKRTPIIALTANAMAHQRAEYDAAGMDDLVPKPIEVNRLFAALEQALAGADEAEGDLAAHG
jgi:signal transduction histidine kinase/CheY-like chemotaxis protein